MTNRADPSRCARVAVIGAGPSGLYLASSLSQSGMTCAVDVFDRLPAPYGLVRYGVAPDHVKMKSVTRVLGRTFDADSVSFYGNVTVGKDISLHELRRHYHAVAFATGCVLDRALGIPGENQVASLGSGAFVGWYSGHIDHRHLQPPLDHSGVAIIGGGNVALDVARVLAKSAAEMAVTDVPDHVLAALTDSQVIDIHVVVRRGPAEVRFTPAELNQIGCLANAQVMVHDDGLLAAGVDVTPTDRRQGENLETLRNWAAEPTGERVKPRTIHLHFMRSPLQLLGDGRVNKLVLERNAFDEADRLVRTDETETLDVGLVIRAIGYRAEQLPDLPFDEDTGTVPNDRGRVVRDSVPVRGTYVTGWIKRGPTGVIGTNKSDAAETAASLLEDLDDLPDPEADDPGAMGELLRSRRVVRVDWASWLRLDAAELALGAFRGAERVKIAELDEMLEACSQSISVR